MLPSDIDDARYAQLVAFCIEYALPLKEASLPVSESDQFPAESWKVLGIAACDTQRVFYLSYDELLLACALRRENVVILRRRGDDMIFLGNVLSDRSKLVTLVSSGLEGTCSHRVPSCSVCSCVILPTCVFYLCSQCVQLFVVSFWLQWL